MGIAEIRALRGMGHLYPKQQAAQREIKVKPGKAPKPVNKRGNKMKVVMAELKKLYSLFLLKNPKCQIQGPNCTHKATAVHHTEGRLPSKIKDVSKWVASCEPCNLWCETHHADAAKKGFKKSKFLK